MTSNERTKATILRHLESLGRATSVHHINGVVEMHALLKSNLDEQRIARIIDGDGEFETYQCASLLAESIGVELENA